MISAIVLRYPVSPDTEVPKKNEETSSGTLVKT